ncbi:hypothetical protein SAMN05421721_11925 [Ectothiorhodospira mobilis]|uniref:Uncharacterized protein n=1 Tax=Ectothiorhodospira mobilis TaxID=195064 RepID=A0A1I4SNB8_ECTMO|nr:hypothetical protein [Ectothiorhodospira mobilis]SFM65964.1 hypothetical protein SAMN05421721_11925 [Ectothiorhodospira mobilis]
MNAIVKNPQEMSAEELYALARQREEQEAAEQEEARRQEREALKQKRRELIKQHRRELAQLDREIRKLGGRVPRAGQGGGKRETGPSRILCEIVANNPPEMTTKEIREQAQQAGLNVKNLSQTLGYLKRQGKLTSPRRGVYSAP